MYITKSLFAGSARVLVNSTQLIFVISLLLLGFSCNKGKRFNNNNEDIKKDIKEKPSNNDSLGIITDIDGNVYQTVKIGDQVWMAENLRTTKYNDGTTIPHIMDNAAWGKLSTPGYCYYNNTTDSESIKKFGALYNWYAVDTKKLAPAGWHVPTDAEWNILENYLIANGYNWDGTTTGTGVAKSLATKTDWSTFALYGEIWIGAPGNDLAKNNKSGFSAFPSGYRTEVGIFAGRIGRECGWWSATENDASSAYNRILCNDYGSLYRQDFYKRSGMSVRLLRDSLFFFCERSKENKDWENTKKINTPDAYSDFLNKYPNSIFSKIADERIEEFIWQDVKKHNTKYAFETYLSLYPDGKFADSSKNKIAGLVAVSVCVSQSDNIHETVTDADGNFYQTVKIGSQVWTVDNLRTTKYNDGSAIPLVTKATAWGLLTTPGYCYYNNTTNADSIKKFGALYNWYVVDTKKLAPRGWRVPKDTDWRTLRDYLIANGYNWDGTTMKNRIAKSLAAKTDWRLFTLIGTIGNELTKNNRSGFSAFPSGYRDLYGNFSSIGDFCYFWSVTENDASYAYSCGLNYGNDGYGMGQSIKSNGHSVRLLRD